MQSEKTLIINKVEQELTQVFVWGGGSVFYFLKILFIFEREGKGGRKGEKH